MIPAENNQICRPCRALQPVVAATILILTGMPGPALGQNQGGTVTVDVARCLELESAEARLACFGAEVDEVLDERSPSGPEVASGADETIEAKPPTARRPEAVGRAAAAPAAEETPGRRESRLLPNTEPAATQPARDSGAESGEFFCTIVDMRERLPNAYVIRLDNGQIWEQTEPKRYPLRPGLEVRIYPTRWGSRYRLTGIETGGNIQVRRVE
jgi:hypothetical protein